MKRKTIGKILTGKFIAWTKSIEDEAVRKRVEQNTIITGGCIVSLLTNEPVNDFDIYFRDTETARMVAEYYVKKLLENPPPTFKGSDQKVDIKAIVEPAIEEGKTALRIGGARVNGPQPARVRIVVKSAGIASAEAKQTDYQYFEGIRDANAQAAATEHYVDAAIGAGGDDEAGSGSEGGFVEGQVTDTTEPEAYIDRVGQLDDESAAKLDDAGELKAGKGGKKTKYRVLFVTSNAITLSDQIQIVLRFQGEPEEIHKNYDFVHCTSFFTSWNKELVLHPEALECILTKELRYIGSRYPVCSLIRLRKFITRGWTVNAGQIVKMAYQVSKLDLDDPTVLEDQLVGVDSAYFAQVIHQLRERSEPTGKIDGTYLMTLIDKIF